MHRCVVDARKSRFMKEVAKKYVRNIPAQRHLVRVILAYRTQERDMKQKVHDVDDNQMLRPQDLQTLKLRSMNFLS